MRSLFMSRQKSPMIAFSCLFLISGCAWRGEATAQDDAKVFDTQIQKYVEIHKKALASVPSLPKETSDAALILKHEKQVGDAIRALRPNAKQGDIFIPEAKRVITAAIKHEVAGKQGAAAKSTILDEGNPKSAESTTPVDLSINAPYPVKAPLSTVPPSVLMALPTLPKELEFRFVGRNLILRDTKANIIVDVLPNAF